MITVRQILDGAWHRETALNMHWVDALNAACRLPGVTKVAAKQARLAVADARKRLKSTGDETTSPLEEAYYALPSTTRFRIDHGGNTRTFPPKGTIALKPE